MRFIAFSIYLANLITMLYSFIIRDHYDILYLKHYGTIELIFSVLFIAAAMFERYCNDEYLKQHFGYQFKIIAIFISSNVLAIIIAVIAFGICDCYDMSGYFFTGASITLIIIGIWFLYKNIKGYIICLYRT